tara:strand:- start:59 stop:1213 length:1155 start_codon:yes stop_codon:yes gene_type:complete
MFGFSFDIWNSNLGSSTPTPSAGSFVLLSWTGAKVSEYDFKVANTTATNYNTILRDGSPQSFDMAIFSDQTVNSDNDFVLSGDTITSAGSSFFVGFGLKSDTGVNYTDLDFAFWVSGSNIVWFESGSSGGTKATVTNNVNQSYRLEYFGSSNEVKLYINNTLVHTATTAYSSDDLAMKLLGRNTGNTLCNHLALKTVQQPDKILVAFGDSITFGRAISDVAGNSYISKALAFTNHNLYANPILANAGDTTADLIADQLPLRTRMYNAGRTANVATVMIGINDLLSAVSLATIKTNITTIVSDLQTTGYEVVLQTVLPEIDTVLPDRILLNDWIIANSIGADYVVDYTGTDLETDAALYEVDKLHPNPTGMEAIANVLWLTLNSL